MPRLSQNIVANLLGTAGTLVVMLACIPPTISLLGLEAYGLIGFCTLLQTMLWALQFGAPTILQRELSVLERGHDQAMDVRPLVTTLEAISWVSAALIAASLGVALPWLATAWLESSLEPAVLAPAMLWMSLAIALQWPANLYHAGLVGLERSAQANFALFLVALVRNLGVLALLWLSTPDLAHYAAWQAASMLAYAVLLRWRLGRELPAGVRRFEPQMLRRHAGYAAGVTGNALTGLFLTQLDKLVLVNLLSLEEFGCYVLASTLTTLFPRLSAPISTAVSPRLMRLAAVGDQRGFAAAYHQTTQFLAILVLPAALLVAIFPHEVLWVWTGDPATVARTAPLVRVLFVSAALNSLMNMPHAAQLAYRWTSLSLCLNLASLGLCTPLQIAGAMYLGPLGVAAAGLVNSLARFGVGVWQMHRRILPGEARRWLLHDLARPLAAGLAVAALVRWLAPLPAGRLELLACLACLGIALFAAAAAATSLPWWLRSRVRGLVRRPKFAGLPHCGQESPERSERSGNKAAWPGAAFKTW